MPRKREEEKGIKFTVIGEQERESFRRYIDLVSAELIKTNCERILLVGTPEGDGIYLNQAGDLELMNEHILPIDASELTLDIMMYLSVRYVDQFNTDHTPELRHEPKTQRGWKAWDKRAAAEKDRMMEYVVQNQTEIMLAIFGSLDHALGLVTKQVTSS